jgi:predicted acylesterase/phospholipase RssA
VDLEALICTDPLMDLLQRTIQLERIRCSNKKLRIAATNWRTGEVRIFTNEDMTDQIGRDIILASSAIPGIFPRVQIENNPYVDGGLVMNTPLKPAIDAGADCLHIVFMDPEVANLPLPKLPNTVNDLFRSLIIGFNAELQRDLASAELVNQQISQLKPPIAASSNTVGAGPTEISTKRLLTVHLYRPSQTLGAGWLSFGRDLIQATIQRGFEDTVGHDCKAANCLIPT